MKRIGRSVVASAAVLLLFAGRHAAQAATLSGQVVDDGAENGNLGIAAVTVVAFNAANEEIRRTQADANGFYKLENLPAGKEFRVSYERIGYLARPTWRSYTLSGDNQSADVLMLQEDAPAPYYDRLAHQIAGRASPEDGWKEVLQVGLSTAKQEQIKQRVGELAGRAAVENFAIGSPNEVQYRPKGQFEGEKKPDIVQPFQSLPNEPSGIEPKETRPTEAVDKMGHDRPAEKPDSAVTPPPPV